MCWNRNTEKSYNAESTFANANLAINSVVRENSKETPIGSQYLNTEQEEERAPLHTSAPDVFAWWIGHQF